MDEQVLNESIKGVDMNLRGVRVRVGGNERSNRRPVSTLYSLKQYIHTKGK